MRKLEVPDYKKREVIDGIEIETYDRRDEHIIRLTDKVNDLVEIINTLDK